jgi:hypothetical protein
MDWTCRHLSVVPGAMVHAAGAILAATAAMLMTKKGWSRSAR